MRYATKICQDGYVYDLETSTKICELTGIAVAMGRRLYRTAKGKFFVLCSFTDEDRIESCSEIKALNLAEKVLSVDELRKFFDLKEV
jgi:hypothetical protein